MIEMQHQRIENTLNSLEAAFTDNLAHSSAMWLSALIEAEEKKLIFSDWRHKVDFQAIESLVTENIEQIEQNWLYNYQKLQRILAIQSKLIYEEVVLILGLRSDLELGLRYIDKKYVQMLTRLDEQFKEVLDDNADEVRRCQGHKQGGFEQEFVNHWWWHSIRVSK